jgi:hypothetical protein
VNGALVSARVQRLALPLDASTSLIHGDVAFFVVSERATAGLSRILKFGSGFVVIFRF